MKVLLLFFFLDFSADFVIYSHYIQTIQPPQLHVIAATVEQYLWYESASQEKRRPAVHVMSSDSTWVRPRVTGVRKRFIISKQRDMQIIAYGGTFWPILLELGQFPKLFMAIGGVLCLCPYVERTEARRHCCSSKTTTKVDVIHSIELMTG